MELTADSWGGVAEAGDTSRGQWFTESKLAMFIHWGPYSHIAGTWRGQRYHGIGEWIMRLARIPVADYEQAAAEFNPVHFDARAWVRLAKDAGMRYIVITAKHHDGFAMFKSHASDFNIVDATPFNRDPLAELAQACAEEGLKLGFYYSQFQDWHEPDAAGNDWEFDGSGDFDRYLQNKAIPQIRELLTNYGPVALIWFDTPGTISREDSQQLFDLVHDLQPDCLVNSRIGNGLGDYSTLGDQEVPLVPLASDALWETIDTHNDTWGYVAHDSNWKSPRQLAHRLIKVVGKGGNYMLNVGPTGDGRIPEMSARILREVGQWLGPRAQAVYHTRPWAVSPLPWGEIVSRPGKLYLHVLDRPADGRLWVTGIDDSITGATLLGDCPQPLEVRRQGDAIAIDLPDEPALASVVALDVQAQPAQPQALPILSSITTHLEAPYADREGCELVKRRWMEKFGDWQHAELLRAWEPTSSATWDIRTFEPGWFYLVAEYAADTTGDGATFEVEVDGEFRLPLPVLPTGDMRDGDWKTSRARFMPQRLGMIQLNDPGAHRVVLRPLSEVDAGAMHLRRLTLEPVV